MRKLTDLRHWQAFAKEIIVWSCLKHPNVAELMGYLFNEHNDAIIVSKWMEKGTALHYVKENPLVDVRSLVCLVCSTLPWFNICTDMK